MKFCATLSLLFAICSIAMAQNIKDDIKNAATNCMKENKIDPKNFEAMTNGKMDDMNATEDMKCFSKCFLEKMDWIDATTGDLKTDAYKSKLAKEKPAEEIEKVIAACKDIKGAHSCDKSFQITKCLHKKNA